MQKFTIHQGLVAPMDRENVDTDAIIPELMAINGAPFRFMRDEKQVAAMRFLNFLQSKAGQRELKKWGFGDK